MVVKSSVLLKYLKEAGRTRVYDPLDAGYTFPERFKRSCQWQKNWEDLDILETSARITFDLDWTDWDHGLAPCRLGGSRSALFPLLIEVGAGNLIVICDFHLSVYVVQYERQHIADGRPSVASKASTFT
jgi:hypothetical protein